MLRYNERIYRDVIRRDGRIDQKSHLRGTYKERALKRPSETKQKEILEFIKEYCKNGISKPEGGCCFLREEDLAIQFSCKRSVIAKMLQHLVVTGVITKRSNRPPHDCRRNTSFMDSGGDHSWISKTYEARRDKNEVK